MSICMVGGLLVSSIVTGRHHHRAPALEALPGRRHGRSSSPASPCFAPSTPPPRCRVGVFMAVLGLGLGATMQNLVLAVQNNVALADMGAGSARSSRSSARWAARSASRRWAPCSATRSPPRSTHGPAAVLGSSPRARRPEVSHSHDPRPRRAAGPVRAIFESAFGEATGHLFLVALPFAVLALVVCALHRGGPAAHDRPARRRARPPRATARARGRRDQRVPTTLRAPRARGRRR